jgi:hypothetical protein
MGRARRQTARMETASMDPEQAYAEARRPNARLARLTQVVQDLSRVRTLPEIMDIVRHASRELANSDGATS